MIEQTNLLPILIGLVVNLGPVESDLHSWSGFWDRSLHTDAKLGSVSAAKNVQIFDDSDQIKSLALSSFDKREVLKRQRLVCLNSAAVLLLSDNRDGTDRAIVYLRERIIVRERER